SSTLVRMSTATGEEPSSIRKRAAILDAATTVFLRNGYVVRSTGQVAALAQVSKQSVYKHFADKESLFIAIVDAAVEAAGDPVWEDATALAGGGDPAPPLRALARRQLEQVMQPRLMQLRRLVIGEANRFPQLGRAFYEQGAGRSVAALAAAF